jgi:hypothetical protein
MHGDWNVRLEYLKAFTSVVAFNCSRFNTTPAHRAEDGGC